MSVMLQQCGVVRMCSNFDRRLLLRRSLTSSQLATALRPFYFLVHPDLFGRHPTARCANEKALKELKNGLDHLNNGKKMSWQPITFYLRSTLNEEKCSDFRKISLDLTKTQAVDKAVKEILMQTGLPTSYLDSLEPLKGIRTNNDLIMEDKEEEEMMEEMMEGSRNTKKLSLFTFLQENVDLARSRLAQCEPFRLELCRLQSELCRQLSLKCIEWESWETQHRRGALDAFTSLLDNHRALMTDVLRDRKLIFGPFSGVSLDGHMVLYIGEVRHNWLRAMESARDQQQVVESTIPRIERALSGVLRDVNVVRRRHQPITHVDDYRQRVRQVITSISDYLSGRQKFPEIWPNSLENLKLCVESASSPLMLSPRGELIVPANCPCFLLVAFITENLQEALHRQEQSRHADELENELNVQCIRQLGLIQLDRDDSISSLDVSTCLKRLLHHAPRLRHLMHGNHLVVSKYFAVQADGAICIPWNWREQ